MYRRIVTTCRDLGLIDVSWLNCHLLTIGFASCDGFPCLLYFLKDVLIRHFIGVDIGGLGLEIDVVGGEAYIDGEEAVCQHGSF